MSWYPPDYEEPKVPFDWDEHQSTYIRYRSTVQSWNEEERRREQFEQLGRLRLHVLALDALLAKPMPYLDEWCKKYHEIMGEICDFEIEL